MMNRVGNQRVGGINMNAPVAAGELIRKTNMVALNADGYLVKATKKEGLTVVGIATSDADNRMGSDGAETASFKSGGFVFRQDGIKETDLMKAAYIKDTETVTTSSVSSSMVGKLIEVDGTYATVLIQP
nr:MAG TPA: hypothetical protein [Caudoviricetes sp.]